MEPVGHRGSGPGETACRRPGYVHFVSDPAGGAY
jgi:hypothetical protein